MTIHAYHSPRAGEDVFVLRGQRWQFVNVTLPDGRRDLGVYAFAGDVCYDYAQWRVAMGIDPQPTA